MKKIILTVLAALTLSSCAKQTFVVSTNGSVEPTKVGTDHFFLSGIGQERMHDAIRVCGASDKVAKVETETTALNNILAILTFGIYTPVEYRVYCKYNF